jgi:hypothetical protein
MLDHPLGPPSTPAEYCWLAKLALASPELGTAQPRLVFSFFFSNANPIFVLHIPSTWVKIRLFTKKSAS